MTGIDMGVVDGEIQRAIELLGASVGMIVAPASPKPYIVIHPLHSGADETALLLDSYRDAAYQVDYVGEGAEQVRHLQTQLHSDFLVGKSWDATKGICGVTVSSASPLRRDDETTWVLTETLNVKVSN